MLCLNVCVWTTSCLQQSKKLLNPWILKLQTTVSQQMDARN